jgi:hypothetical protein
VDPLNTFESHEAPHIQKIQTVASLQKKKKNCPISLDCFLDPFFMIVKCYPLIQQFHIAITVAMSHPKQRIAVINNAGVMFKILRVKTRFSKISLKMDKNDTLTAIPNKCMLASKISKI